MWDWKLECQITIYIRVGTKHCVLEGRSCRTEGPVLLSLMQWNSPDAWKVRNWDVRVEERLIQVLGSFFEGQDGFL